MKQALLLATFSIIWSISSFAQCTPDPQFTSQGLYPDSITGLEQACVGVPYTQVITHVVPVDTTFFIGPVSLTLTVDSIVVTGIAGLPPGITYSCFDGQNVTSPSDGCSFEGGTIGCLSIDGTPTAGDVGVHNLEISLDLYLSGQTTPQATTIIDYYNLEVIAASICAVGMNDISTIKFNLFPNPVNESFTLDGLDGLHISTVCITNSEGKILVTDEEVTSSSVDLNVAHFDSGIYFIRITHDNYVDVVRFIKE
ncbi:MAG: T9SS type A sorting domain-containing protein [Fluviicola sp.]|nr:T9SS type A sorting domain-containing protein [Fluviicola sp.]